MSSHATTPVSSETLPAPSGLRERGRRNEYLSVAALACLSSMAGFLWFFTRGQLLLYGDAVAHINIARRVFDSRTPGPVQLGTVWLPLPHLLTIPFLFYDWMWRSGVGGSVPSMAAYILAVIGIYRLVRGRASRFAAWLAAGLLGLNPNLLYMQATAMTESIFLAAVIWAVVYFDQFVLGLFPTQVPAKEPPSLPAWKSLERCAVVLAAGILTRYDGWVFAFVVGCAALAVSLLWHYGGRNGDAIQPARAEARGMVRSIAAFLLLCALVPALWLAHNYAINQHPLDWLNGPYSAKAIEQRTAPAGQPPYPGKNNVKVAALYFLKAAKLNLSWGRRQGWMLAIATLGTLLALPFLRPATSRCSYCAWLLLWFPLPFYAYSVAYGSVPIFVPVWWPFSYYNVRYGLELLPAFAVFSALLADSVRRRLGGPGRTAAAVLLVFFSANYAQVALAVPVCLREARVNSATRMALESHLAAVLRALPPNATLLMHTSDYVGALQAADFHLQRVVNETTGMVWQAGLSCPAAVAGYVVAVQGDPVWTAVHGNPRWLRQIAGFSTPGKPYVAVYRSTFPAAQPR